VRYKIGIVGPETSAQYDCRSTERNCADVVLLASRRGRESLGKALDIQQSGPVLG